MADHRIGMQLTVDAKSFKSELDRAILELKNLNREIDNKGKKLQQSVQVQNKQNQLSQTNVRNMKEEIRMQKQLNSEIGKQTNLAQKNHSLFSGIKGIMPLLGIGSAIGVAGNMARNSMNLQTEFGTTANLLKVGKDSSQFQQAQNDVRSIAFDTSSNIMDILASYNEALSANLDQDTATAISRQAGIVGTGSNIDPSVVTSSLISIVNTFKKSAEDLPEISNMIAGLMDISVGSAESVVGSLPTFMAGGKGLGFDLKEQLVGFSALTQQGFSPEESATRLNALFTGLASKNKVLAKEGITQSSVAEMGFFGTMEAIKKAVEKKQSPGEKIAFLSEAFGNVRENQAGQLISSLGLDELKTQLEALNRGDVVTNFERNAGNLSAEIRQMKTGFQNLFDTVWNTNTALGSFVGGINDFIGGLSNILGVDKGKNWTEQETTAGKVGAFAGGIINDTKEDTEKYGFLRGVTGLGSGMDFAKEQAGDFLENNMVSNLIKDVTGKEKLFNFDETTKETDNLKISFSELKKPVDTTKESVFTLAQAIDNATTKINEATSKLQPTASTENASEKPTT